MPVAPDMRPYWRYPQYRLPIVLFLVLALIGFVLVFLGAHLNQQPLSWILIVLAVLVLAADFVLFMTRIILPYYRNHGQADKERNY